MKFIMLINVKMSKIVGILTFISRINTTYGSLKAREIFIFQYFVNNEISCSHELSMKKSLITWSLVAQLDNIMCLLRIRISQMQTS